MWRRITKKARMLCVISSAPPREAPSAMARVLCFELEFEELDASDGEVGETVLKLEVVLEVCPLKELVSVALVNLAEDPVADPAKLLVVAEPISVTEVEEESEEEVEGDEGAE